MADHPDISEDNHPIIIVGGGIIGITIAYALRNSDRPVRVLEKDTLGSGTTGASIAHFVRHQDSPTWAEVERRQRAWEWYEPRIADGTFSFDQCGTLHVVADQTEWEELQRLATAHANHGLTTEILDATALNHLGLDSDTLRGGFLLPNDGVLDPAEIIQYCATEAREAGVVIETGIEVTGVNSTERRVSNVKTSERTYEAGTVINAAGPWAPELNSSLGVTAPVRHTAGPILVLQTDCDFSLPLTFFEDDIYLRHEANRQLLAGQFTTSYDEAKRVDPDGAWPIEEAFYVRVAEIVERYLPSSGDYRVQNDWLGIRTITPDGYPIVGRTSVDGYYLAIGMSGYGITLAPMIAEAVATLVQTDETPEMIGPLANDRFTGHK